MKRVFEDQLGCAIEIAERPQRIVSLVPSQTELLYDLGLEDEVVGVTKFCIHPEMWFRNKTRVGGTKTINIASIEKLAPDLIIANKEENVQEQIDDLKKLAPVWVSDIKDFETALVMIQEIGNLTGTEERSQEIIAQIRSGFETIEKPPIFYKTAYLIWREPFMAAGSGTFIDDMMQRCGFQNIFAAKARYPEASVEQLRECELLLLSSEPYPFKQKHIDELQHQLLETKIILVDGEMFSWYGSRLIQAAPYLKSLIAEIQSYSATFNS